MAKRRKLEAPDAAELAALGIGFAAKPVADRLGISAPIAAVAAEAARLSQPQSAEHRVKAAHDARDAGAWRAAVEEGRLVADLALSDIVTQHLVRDRLSASVEEMEELVASLRLNGQRLPIEVVSLPDGRYGLISGWRRVMALSALAKEAGEEGRVRAIVRSPREAGATYAAMVEENEIRSPLTPYERGRIAVVAADQGAFRDPEAAVDAIYAAASKAKRSKIRSFALVHEELGDMLTFPADLSERNGLRLAQALRQGLGDDLRTALASGLGTDAAREWGVLGPVVARADGAETPTKGGRPRRAPGAEEREDLANGITMERMRHEDGYAIRLRGRVVDADLVDAVMAEVRRLLGPL